MQITETQFMLWTKWMLDCWDAVGTEESWDKYLPSALGSWEALHHLVRVSVSSG